MVMRNASASMPLAGNIRDNEHSTTHAAISPATITLGGQTATADQLAGLSRDTDNAAQALKPIFDLQQVQDRLELGQLIGEIIQSGSQIVGTALQRSDYVARDQAIKAAEDQLTPEQWQTYKASNYNQTYLANTLDNRDFKYRQALNTLPAEQRQAIEADTTGTLQQRLYQNLAASGQLGTLAQTEQNYQQSQADYGPGSAFSRASQALQSVAAGLASGNNGQAVAGALAPALAGGVGHYFDRLETDANGIRQTSAASETGRLLAHAAVGAASAYIGGNHPASGAAGAVSGEAMAQIVQHTLYGNRGTDTLSPSEKETIRAVSTLASGLVGAAQGGSFETAATAAAAGQNAVENNFLTSQTVKEKGWLSKEEIALLDKIARQAQAPTIEYYLQEYDRIQKSSLSASEKDRQTKQLLSSYEAASKRMEAAASALPVGSKERGIFISAAGKMSNLIGLIPPYEKSPLIRSEQRDWLPVSNPVMHSGDTGFVAVQRQWAINDGRTSEEARFQTEMPVAGRGGNVAKANGTKGNVESVSGSKSKVSDSRNVNTIKQPSSVDGEMAGGNKALKSPSGDYILPVGRQTIDPTRTSFSQATVSYQKRGKDYNYDSMVSEMKKQRKWIGEPVDVVNMPGRVPTSMDNTRIMAAREAGVKVEANVHNFNDFIPIGRARTLQYEGKLPKTWGEAIQFRIKRQETQKGVPTGWSQKFPDGSIYDVKVIKK